MKNCPLCAAEYYDEAKWCPDCEYDFPAGAPTPPPDADDIWRSLERLSDDGEPDEGPAAAIAERIADLYREADGDANVLWKRSPEFLKTAEEYALAKRLFDRWKNQVPRMKEQNPDNL
jgi:hypothetical protein